MPDPKAAVLSAEMAGDLLRIDDYVYATFGEGKPRSPKAEAQREALQAIATGRHIVIPADQFRAAAIEWLAMDAGRTGGEWELQTGSSWRRFGSKYGRDGDVICPTTYSCEDRHPDLHVKEQDAAFIAACTKDWICALMRVVAGVAE